MKMDPYDDTRPALRLVGGTDYESKKLGVPREHRGVLFGRVLPGQHPQEDTRRVEAAFVEEWSARNSEEPFLEKLLSTSAEDPQRRLVPQTEREWQVAHLVAATLAQWLPTSVGCGFLKSAFRRGDGDLKYRLPSWNEFSR